MSRLHLLSSLAGTGALSVLVGCGDSLPDVALLNTVRPLAARVEVTQPLVPDDDPDAAPRAQALPFETVTITPLLAGPQGIVDADTLAPLWFACPLSPTQSLYGCISSEFPITMTDIPPCESPVPIFDLDFSEIPEPQGLCQLGQSGTSSMTVPFDFNILSGGGIELTMIAGAEDGTSTETCAEVLLSGDIDVPDDCVLLLQRVTVGPLERLFALAESFGVTLPEEFGDVELEDIPDFDRHPRITSVGVQPLDEDGNETSGVVTEIPDGGALTATYGDRMRFNAVTPVTELQTFTVESANGEIREETEAYLGAWYRTWGKLQSDSSNDPVSFNDFSLEEGSQDESPLPEDDTVEFIYVVRDGRSGVDWWSWSVEASAIP
ncbi:MAG: hypothetical protein ACPHRO_07330 [Nannocystaceae bacterium]